MKNIIKKLMITLTLLAGMLMTIQPVVTATAIGSGVKQGIESARGVDQPSNLFGDNGIFKRITNIMLFMIGVLSVIMLIVGGMHYVVSGGKKESVTTAKNTILYAIVGLIVSLLAYAIINFIINVFVGGGDYSGTNI